MDYGLIESVTFSRFCDSFSDTYRNNFSYEGKRALYDYLIQYCEDCGENIELDTIALCCEYSEYDDAIEGASNYFAFEGMTYGKDGEELETREEVEEKAHKFLEDNTMVIDCENGHIIIQDF